MEIKNKEWNAGEKPKEKSLRSTLTCFKGDYLKRVRFILMQWCTCSKLISAMIFKAAETLVGAPVIV